MSLQSNDYKRVLWASESTPGTDAVEAILNDETADILYQDVRSALVRPNRVQVEVPRARGSHSGNKQKSIPSHCNVEVEFPILPRRGTGSGEESPHIAPVLRAMNFGETTVDSTSWTANPATKAQDPMSIHVYQRNLEDDLYKLYRSTQVRGSGSITLPTEGEPYGTFTGVGDFYEETDAAAFFDSSGEIALLPDASTSVTARTTGTEAYVDQDFFVCTSVVVQVDSQSWEVSEITLDLGWSTDQIKRITGNQSLQIPLLTRGDTGSKITLNIVCFPDSTQLEQIESAIHADSEIGFNSVITTASERLTVDGPKMQITDIEDQAEGGTRGASLPCVLNGDWSSLVADNDFTMKWDAAP